MLLYESVNSLCGDVHVAASGCGGFVQADLC